MNSVIKETYSELVRGEPLANYPGRGGGGGGGINFSGRQTIFSLYPVKQNFFK